MDDAGELAAKLVSACDRLGLVLATAESCTGGMVAAAITDVPGSSAVFDRGFVTYSNAAKADMLGVADATLEAHGAVSSETAAEMALGAVARSRADIAVAVTGIAGPGGGTALKPVGLVHLAIAQRRDDEAVVVVERRLDLSGSFERAGRSAVRSDTVRTALQLAFELVATP